VTARLTAVLVACAAALAAQVAEKANSAYKSPEGRAGMMKTLAAPDRAEQLQAERIVAQLQIRPGMAVADLGAGAGVLLPYLSKAVGAQGKVYSQDIFDDFISHARAYAKQEGLKNIEFVKGTEKDVRLPERSVDLAVTVDAYHHFDYPAETLATLRKALKPGGRFAIVDYYKRPGAMGDGPRLNLAVEHIRLDLDDVIKEVTSNGFRLLEWREHVPGKQYLAIFTPALQ
jgi:ubiquinone/menaquinone biosynthesis C-methylase UbiE